MCVSTDGGVCVIHDAMVCMSLQMVVVLQCIMCFCNTCGCAIHDAMVCVSTGGHICAIHDAVVFVYR